MCLPHAVAQAESMSNIVMDVTPSMILIIDKELRIRECNKKAQKMLGVSREEALERYILNLLSRRISFRYWIQRNRSYERKSAWMRRK